MSSTAIQIWRPLDGSIYLNRADLIEFLKAERSGWEESLEKATTPAARAVCKGRIGAATDLVEKLEAL